MKTFTTLVLGLLLIPSVSSAAALTQVQAESLISVVQSSPETPASAFTNLITAFSSITVAQAESLITVVKAASEVPADAFVDMLLAFTVDPVQPVVQVQTLPVETINEPVVGNAPVVDNTPVVVAPVVESVVMPPVEKLRVSNYSDLIKEGDKIILRSFANKKIETVTLPEGISIVGVDARDGGYEKSMVTDTTGEKMIGVYRSFLILSGIDETKNSLDITVVDEDGQSISTTARSNYGDN